MSVDASQPPGRATRRSWLSLLAATTLALLAALLLRRLSSELSVPEVQGWVEAQGAFGMVWFGAAYAVAALLFVPGAALTLVAGAVFGLGRGMIVVSIASSVADGTAFLIGRYLARDAVAHLARRYRRFAVLDAAIAEGGWRVVALLRLSPTVPYSASNYLYGLTGISFLPYWVTTWAFTLPGTFAYVYLGYVGAVTLNQDGRAPLEWGLLIVGLVATLAAAVYLAILARRALRRLEVPAPQA